MSVTKQKKKTWIAFSKYIRLRDCLITTGSKTVGTCLTCGKIFPFKELQAGHFVGGRTASVLFVEDNCHAQCYQCNVLKHGNLIEYYPLMIRLYGQKRVEELKALRFQTHQWTEAELKELEEYYKQEYKVIYEGN